MNITGQCLIGATSEVADDCKMIRIMIRLACDGMPTGFGPGDVTGWVAMHSTDDDADTVAQHFMDGILPQNPHIEPILHTPGPCRFDWSDEESCFVQTE